MLCLGIETSCDETSLALVEDGTVLGQTLSSQADIHALFGGVVPELASREHGRLIGPLFDRLDLGGRTPDVVAFARGPGLLGSLLVGAAFAKSLSLGFGCRLLGINHLHAHLLAAGLEGEIRYPALGLLVSGGHTQIYRMESPLRFLLLGRTLDDAAGEAFDKVGKLLGLAYPAGRVMDEMAAEGHARDLFPLPYMGNDNLDFSFSGLKTAASLYISREGLSVEAEEHRLRDFCASFNRVVARTLAGKFGRAIQREEGIRSLVLAGGVAANSAVRREIAALADRSALPLLVPSPRLCTDNGSMIAYAGYLIASMGLAHGAEVSCVPRGTPVPDDYVSVLDTGKAPA